MKLFLVLLSLFSVLYFGVQAGKPLESRIHTGDEVDDSESHSYAATIYHNLLYKCTGSIISLKHVITAAQCVANDDQILAYHIISNRLNLDDAGKEHKITNITLHPDYEGRSEYDVAILQVKNPFAWNQIIKIAPPSYNPDEGDATIVGWGKNEIDDPLPSSELREGNVHILPKYICRSVFAAFNTSITDSSICTDGKQSGCNGDSGLPLVDKSSKKLIGILVQGSFYCAGPSIYIRANASPIRRFIEQYTGLKIN